jgi:two-component system response regulator LytT
MMKAVIIEDEHSAVLNLEHILESIEPNIQIIETIDTVSDAIAFFQKENGYDLVFMDIRLADGISFEIFKEVEPTAPIVFTTAYDQYAIQAFKVNSIDYLLKPIQEEDLKNAIDKFKQSLSKSQSTFSSEQVKGILNLLKQQKKSFRQSYLVQKGDTLTPVASNDFAFFFIQNGVVRGTTNENVIYHLDGKLEDLENELNPEEFFRANRQYLIQRTAIKNLSVYFNGRLIVNTLPKAKEQIIVSKANAPKFKAWLNHA